MQSTSDTVPPNMSLEMAKIITSTYPTNSHFQNLKYSMFIALSECIPMCLHILRRQSWTLSGLVFCTAIRIELSVPSVELMAIRTELLAFALE